MAHPAILSNLTLQITGIDIRNFKRIKAFKLELDPSNNLITIGGENTHGKSSILEAIENALVGVPRTQTKPVHEGASGAGIRITIPPYEVKRLFDAEGKPSLKITRLDDGTEVPRATEFLKQLIGSMFVNPLEFLNAQPIAQRKILADLIGLDMDSIDAEIEESRRTEKNLDEHQKKVIARVDLLPWHEDAPTAEVSIAELSDQLREIHEYNNGVEQAKNAVTLKRQSIAGTEELLDRAAGEIERLKRQLTEAENRKATLEDTLTGANQELINLQTVADGMQTKPSTEVEAQISGVEAANRKFRENEAKTNAKKDWTIAEAELGDAIARTKMLEAEKKRMLSEAAFPVEGLAFDATQILLHDLPFRQASHAEQIRAAVAISLAMRGQIAPILIPDASTIDAKILRLIAEEAAKHNAQVFAEVIANQDEDGFDRDCSIYIVDGGNTDVAFKGAPKSA